MNITNNKSLVIVCNQVKALGDVDYVIDIANQLFIQAIKSSNANDQMVRDKYCFQHFYLVIPTIKQIFNNNEDDFDTCLQAERVDLTLNEMFELWFVSEVLEDCLSNESRSDIIGLLKAFNRIVELMDNQKNQTLKSPNHAN